MRPESKTFVLPDGRRMSFADYGAPEGMPVLFCHGIPGSRWQVHPGMAAAAAEINIRVILPERPGYGLSDQQPNRTMLDWASDAARLMDHLDLQRFAVLSISGGSLFALACGYAMPDRITSITLAGALAENIFAPEVAAVMLPLVAQTLAAARDTPQALVQSLGAFADDPGKLLEMMVTSLPASDKALFENPEIRNSFLRNLEESLRHCEDSLARDYALATRDWGFALENIQTRVSLWHGSDDLNTPPAMAEYLAKRLPHHQLHWLPGEGHLCLFTHWKEILRATCKTPPNLPA